MEIKKKTMKNKLYWIDLSLCLGWIISILGYRYAFASGVALFLALIVVMLRLTVTNDLLHLEKRTWLPLSAFCILYLFSFLNRVHLGFEVIVDLPVNILNRQHSVLSRPFNIFDLPYDRVIAGCICIGMFLWIFLFPIVFYISMLIKKRLSKTDLSWKDLMGGILWKDKNAVLSSKLALICIGAIFAGLSMDMRMCLFMTIVASTVSFVLICRHMNIKNHRRIGFLLLAMLIFFFAQSTAGIFRISLLGISLILVIYCLMRIFQTTRQYLLTAFGILYLGIILPSLAIGNNQYACIDYARRGFYTVPGYKGVFYLIDRKTDLIGLRDRYGMILKPEYERIASNHRGGSGFWNRILELKKNGYTRYFDLNNTKIIDDCSINDSLQKDICDIVSEFVGSERIEHQDGCEIRITQLASNKTVAWVRMINYGKPITLYEDSKTGALDDDFEEWELNEFVRDTLNNRLYEDRKQILGYVTNFPNDSLPVFRVGIKMATEEKQDTMAVVRLLDKIKSIPTIKQAKDR